MYLLKNLKSATKYKPMTDNVSQQRPDYFQLRHIQCILSKITNTVVHNGFHKIVTLAAKVLILIEIEYAHVAYLMTFDIITL